MCGIVGYIGNKKASPILIDGLLKLEYRGYDSAGLTTIENGTLYNMKNKGRVNNLANLKGVDKLNGTIGIAHTRWATHGKPCRENAHPHLDNSNTFAVVHNGIIENYHELRKFLTDNGYSFLSETDSETIPNLIHYYYSKDKNNDEHKFLRAVNSACKDLTGSYAIEVLCKDCPNKIIVARKDMPIVVGKGDGENFVASDIPAILSFTKNFYLINDGDFVELYKDNATFYDSDLNILKKKIKNVEWDASAAEKDGYEDYMLKEIFEQPNSVRETIGSRLTLSKPCSFEDLDISKSYLSSVNKIYIVACGTAMHAGLVAKTMFERLCRIPVIVDIASEFRYRDPLIDKKTLAIFISQSGETADTLAALKLARRNGAKTISISNVIGSSITREAHYNLYTHAGPEIAVASTKAYTSQIVLLSILAIHFAEILEKTDESILEDLKKEILALPEKIEEVLKNLDTVKDFAKKIFKEKDVFFLGRGMDYNVSLEAALKLKEISYIHADAYASGELKHGSIALIEKGITVIGTITDSALVEKSISNLQEVITRGAKTLIITNQHLKHDNFDVVIDIPEVTPLLAPVISVIPLQMLAYYVSKDKGLDVDKPRNLAKSVTVE